jgi:hypothetical protein
MPRRRPAASSKFISEIERQISWATRASSTTIEQRRTDYALLLEQVPAIDRLIYLDARAGSNYDWCATSRPSPVEPIIRAIPGSRNARQVGLLSPIYFDGPDPFMAVCDGAFGSQCRIHTVAEVNLKFVSPFIDRSRIGEDVEAIVVGPRGRLIAPSNPEVRLGTHLAALPQVASMIKGEPVNFGKDAEDIPS